MSKLRAIYSLIRTKNYVVITDTISDGFVLPEDSLEIALLLDPIQENLKQQARLNAKLRNK